MGLAQHLLLVAAFATCTYAIKYQQWFYWYNRDGYLDDLSRNLCNETFTKYVEATVDKVIIDGNNDLGWCYLHDDCILANLRPSYLQNYQSAAVILGILPTLLASLGPRIAEVSLLSTHRPLLSFLLSVGAPAVWPTRVFTYDDPAQCLGRGPNRLTFKKKSFRASLAINGLEYALAAGSVVNMMQIAYMLGKLTVLAWSCQFDYGPLAWSLIPMCIHFLAAMSYKMEIVLAERFIQRESEKPANSSGGGGGNGPGRGGDLRLDPAAPLMRSSTFIRERHETPWYISEFKICANHPKGMESLLKFKKMSPLAVFLNCIASLCAFFHLLFGTMLFSSLLYIAVWDIMNLVLWRYLLSTAVCRLILLFELAGMREAGLEDVDVLKLKTEELESDITIIKREQDSLHSVWMSPSEASPRSTFNRRATLV